MIVLDASIAVNAISGGELGHEARLAILEGDLAAPEIIDLEVLSTWRTETRIGGMDEHRARAMIERFRMLPLHRFSHSSYLRRIWDLRDNLTTYDAAYVALAESLDALLLTSDVGMANAPGIQCEVRLLAS